MPKDRENARVQVSWLRRQWLKVVALIEDHPFVALLAGGLLVGFVLFYGIRLNGFAHFRESGARWRLDSFGGTHRVDRSVRIPDVILSFHRFQCDRLDLSSMTAAHMDGTAFRKELREIAAEPGGRIRMISLDPRISEPGHARHEQFAALAAAFGLKDWEYRARCWHSAAVLIHLKKELGDAIEVRFLTGPAEGAEAPFFTIGRSGHAYRAADSKKRLDIIVERPGEATGSDSFTHPAAIHMDRPKNAEVLRFTAAFEAIWETAAPLDETLMNELLTTLRGEGTPGS